MRACLIGDSLLFIGAADPVPPGSHEVSIDPSAASLQPRDLVFDGAMVRARSSLTTWHIDAMGNWHGVSALGRQPLDVTWGTQIIKDGTAWRAQSEGERLAPAINKEFYKRVAATGITEKRGSMNSYLGALNAKVIDGDALTADEASDCALLRSIDAWEGDMVEMREALIAAADTTYQNDAHWPPKPAGLTPTWLAGF